MSPSTPSLRLPSRSHSRRPASRPRASRNSSLASVLYLPRNPEALINPDGQIGEDAAELLQEFVHPHRHEIDATLVEEDLQGENLEGSPEDEDNEDEDDQFEAENAEWRQNLLSLPWWRRPSSLWSVFSLSSTKMQTICAIQVHHPHPLLRSRHVRNDRSEGRDLHTARLRRIQARIQSRPRPR